MIHLLHDSRFKGFGKGLLLLGICLCVAASSHAASLSWNPTGGPGGAWGAETNWYDSILLTNTGWVSGDDAVFGSGIAPNTFTTGGAVTVDAGGVTVQNITFNLGGYALSGDTITLAGTPAFTVTNATDRATIADVIQGAVALGKAGSGTLVLSGANTYSGGTTISAGILQFANPAAMSAAGTVTVNGGSTLAVNAGVAGDGQFVDGTGNGMIGGLLNGLGGQGAPVTLAANSSLGIDTTNATGTVTVTSAFSHTNTLGLVKLGAGTLELTNGGTFNGNGAAGFPFVVRQGTLKLSGSNGTTPTTYAVTGEAVIGGTFTTAVGAAGYDATLQIDGGALNVSGYLSVGRGNGIGGVSSNLILNNGATISAANLSAGYNGGNAANKPKGAITLNNTSALTVTGANFLVGESNGSDLTLTINDSATVSATAANVRIGNNGSKGTLVMNGGTLNAGSLAIARNDGNSTGNVGSVTINSGATLNSEGDVLLGFAGSAADQAQLTLNGGTLNVATTIKRWLIIGQWDNTNNTVNVNSGSNLNLDSNTDIRFRTGYNGTETNVFNLNGGNVTSYSNNATTANGAGVVDLMYSGTATDNCTFNLNGGTLTISQVISSTNNGTRTFNFNGGVLKPTVSTTNFIALGTGTAVANVRNGGAIIDSNGKDITIAQPLLHSNVAGDLAIDGGLSKQGAGTLTLSNTATYTGPTTVNGGSLILSDAGLINTSSAITVNGGGAKFVQNSSTAVSPVVTLTNGTVDGAQTIDTVTVANSAGNVIANGGGGTGSLTINNLTFKGAAAVNLSPATPLSTPALYATSLITSNGGSVSTGKITVNASASSWAPGVNYLIGYSTLTGVGFADFLKGTISGLSNRQSATLANPAGYIALTIAGDNPVWTGALNGNWTTSLLASPKNWNLLTGGTATDYINGDIVLFDDSAAGTTNVSISSANVAPKAVIFNNNSYAYTINGPYGIVDSSSPTSLLLKGYGSVTLNGANTYSGGTTVNSGTLNINNANAIGGGALTINGGAIDNTSGAAVTLATTNTQNWNADFAFGGTNDLDLGANNVPLTASRTITTNGTARLIVGGAISGTGFDIAKAGTGYMVISGANTYTGSTIIDAGTLEISGGTTGNTNANIQISPNSGDNGTLKVSGGIVNADRVIIGGNTGNTGNPGDGALILSNGTINSREWFTVGSGGGGTSPTGTFTMTGGTLNVVSQQMEVANFANTTGVVTMSGSASAINIQNNNYLTLGANANARNGTFTQNDGTVTFYSDAGTTVGGTGILYLGRSDTLSASSAYSYNLNGGTLIVPEITRNTATGNQSSGYFNFNGGTLKAAKATATWMHDLTGATLMEGGAIIDDGGYAVTIAQNLASYTGVDGGLRKQGAGTLTLSGASSWSGPTVVTAGTLAVTGSIDQTSAVTISGGTLLVSATGTLNTSGGAITVNGAGAKLVYANTTTGLSPNVTVTTGTLDGAGTVANTVTVGNGTGGIIANGNGGTGALTIGSLTFDGVGTISLNTASTSPVLLTTNLTTSYLSSDKITLNAANASWTSGTVYDLIGYSTLNGVGFADFVKGTITGLTPRQSATLTNPAGFIALSIAGGNIPVWTGAKSGDWTTTAIPTPKNWKLQTGGATTDFIAGDTVLFDDSATGTTAVNISDANVSPTSTTFNNAGKSYSISSTSGYGISSGYLVKSGSGALAINTANTYAGGTTLNAGTLDIDNASAIGAGSLTVTGGTIDNTSSGGAITLTTNIPLNLKGDFTFTGTHDLNLGAGDVSLDGTTGPRTITVTAGTLTVGSIPVATTGIGLTKAGAGTLSLSGSAISRIDGTLGVTGGTIQTSQDLYVTGLAGSGTVEATLNKWFFVNNAVDNAFNGVIQDGSGLLGLRKLGAGKLTLTGNNSYSLATTVGEGTLVFSGATNNTSQQDTIGDTAGVNGVLIVSPGASFSANWSDSQFTSSLAVGTNATAAGGIRLSTGGTLAVAQQFGLGSGTGGYAAYTQNGGTATVGSFMVVGFNNDRSIANINGGSLNIGSNLITVAAGGAGSIGVMNLSGGAVTSTATTGYGPTIGGIFVGENGTGALNVSNSAALALSGWGLRLGHNTGATGTVNLLGGTVTTTVVSQGAGSGTVNFNGGTLKAGADSTTFMQGLANAYLYGGGATIDDGGHAITIAQALLAPTGSGVSATGLTLSGGGFIDTPLVQIAGDGTGASAVANIDAGGNLTGITITNPGVNYSYATFTLLGGGVGNTGAIGGSPSIVPNVCGGLTKIGSGALTLTGANTYTGNTTVLDGTLTTLDINTPAATVTVTGASSVLNATSIVADTLNIGTSHVAAVPEPGALVLLALAGLALVGACLRRK